MTDKEQPIARAAEILGKSPRTVLRWIQSGKVPAQKIDGQWYVDVSGVMPSERPAPADVISEKDAAISDLRKEVSLLRSQLAEKDRQIVELHTLLGRAQKALPNPTKKRWWVFWKR